MMPPLPIIGRADDQNAQATASSVKRAGQPLDWSTLTEAEIAHAVEVATTHAEIDEALRLVDARYTETRALIEDATRRRIVAMDARTALGLMSETEHTAECARILREEIKAHAANTGSREHWRRQLAPAWVDTLDDEVLGRQGGTS